MSQQTETDDLETQSDSSNNSNEINSTSMRPTDTKITFTFGKCKICTDTATGVHYGIVTCEGCKGFYKRSLSKHKSYFCYNKNNCIINMITRNRCKSCRFKKCVKQGMSIDGIRMGRIPKSEKLNALKKQKSLNITDDETNVSTEETHAQSEERELEREEENSMTDTEIKDSAMVICNQKYNEIEAPYRRKEFKCWLNSQIEFVKKNDITKLELNHINTCIRLKLHLNEDQTSLSLNPLLNFFENQQLFDSKSILPLTIFQSENDLFLISILKDKVFQLYKKHIQLAPLIVKTRECHRNKDYTDSSVENVPVEVLLKGLIDSISEHSKWLTRFARDLPGFGRINVDDFIQMVSGSAMLLFGLIANPFYNNNENHTVISNNYQFSRSRMNKVLGTFKTGLLFEFHYVFKKLLLSENELALLYPFILTSSNADLIKEKDMFYQIKNYYNKILIYEFELNRRDATFYANLKELFEITEVLELKKGQFNPNIQ